MKWNSKLRAEIIDSPELALAIVDALPDDPVTKRRRISSVEEDYSMYDEAYFTLV